VATVAGQLVAIVADKEVVPKAVAVLLLTSIAWDVCALLLAVWVSDECAPAHTSHSCMWLRMQHGARSPTFCAHCCALCTRSPCAATVLSCLNIRSYVTRSCLPYVLSRVCRRHLLPNCQLTISISRLAISVMYYTRSQYRHRPCNIESTSHKHMRQHLCRLGHAQLLHGHRYHSTPKHQVDSSGLCELIINSFIRQFASVSRCAGACRLANDVDVNNFFRLVTTVFILCALS
jgi:hypothetical protein